MSLEKIKKIYVGQTYNSCGCHCGGSSYPTFIYLEGKEIKEEQVMAQNNSPNVLIKGVSMITTIDKKYKKYKSLLEALK